MYPPSQKQLHILHRGAGLRVQGLTKSLGLGFWHRRSGQQSDEQAAAGSWSSRQQTGRAVIRSDDFQKGEAKDQNGRNKTTFRHRPNAAISGRSRTSRAGNTQGTPSLPRSWSPVSSPKSQDSWRCFNQGRGWFVVAAQHGVYACCRVLSFFILFLFNISSEHRKHMT